MHAGLHAKGNGTGGNRCHPAVYGAGVRQSRPDCGSTLHLNHRASWCHMCGSPVSETIKERIEIEYELFGMNLWGSILISD